MEISIVVHHEIGSLVAHVTGQEQKGVVAGYRVHRVDKDWLVLYHVKWGTTCEDYFWEHELVPVESYGP